MSDAVPPPVPSPPPSAQIDCPLCGHPSPAAGLDERAGRLIARQEEVLRTLEKLQRKGWWDRLPVVVGILGLLFTTLYQINEVLDRRAEQQRAEEARRLELMSKFFPHLISADPAAQRGAVLALHLLADSALAAAAVVVAPSRAAALALHEVRMNPVTLEDEGYVGSVIRRLPQMVPVTGPSIRPTPGSDTTVAPVTGTDTVAVP